MIYEGIIFVARRLIMANGRPQEDGMGEDSHSSTHAGRFLYWVPLFDQGGRASCV